MEGETEKRKSERVRVLKSEMERILKGRKRKHKR